VYLLKFGYVFIVIRADFFFFFWLKWVLELVYGLGVIMLNHFETLGL
jgi:hypothetical protein